MNIGRCLRCLDGALDHALAEDRQRAGGGGDDDVVGGQVVGQIVQRDGAAAEALRQRAGALQGAVGDGDVLGVLRGEMVGAQLDHLAGADEQHVLLVDAGENALRQAHRGGGHGNRVGADRGRCAHFLGHREGALEQLVQQRAQGAGLFGGLHRLLHLPEDLGFAQHHRIQPAGDAEGVLHRFLLAAACKDRARWRGS